MADIEITDEASLEAWLKTRPRRDAEIIAFRAAARVFPLWGRAMEEPWVQSWRGGNLPPLRQIRSLLLAYLNVVAPEIYKTPNELIRSLSVESENFFRSADTESYKLRMSAQKIRNEITLNRSSTKIRKNSKLIANYEERAQSIFALSQISLAVSKSLSLFRYENISTAILNAAQVVGAADRAVKSENRMTIWFAISRDCTKFSLKLNLSSLWDGPPPQWFTEVNLETRAIWAKDPPTWAFWERWWDGVISGNMPFPPELLRDVALIEDDIWQAGPKAVAERINLLIQRHALQREAAAINARLMEFIAFNEGLGANLHNQPPDDELSPVKLRATLGEISQALKEIEVALDGPEISPEVVVGLAQRLKDLWDGLTTKMKIAIGGLAIVCVTGFSQFSSGFMGAAGEDFYQLAKRNIDIPSFSRRLLDFGKELEKTAQSRPSLSAALTNRLVKYAPSAVAVSTASRLASN